MLTLGLRLPRRRRSTREVLLAALYTVGLRSSPHEEERLPLLPDNGAQHPNVIINEHMSPKIGSWEMCHACTDVHVISSGGCAWKQQFLYMQVLKMGSPMLQLSLSHAKQISYSPAFDCAQFF